MDRKSSGKWKALVNSVSTAGPSTPIHKSRSSSTVEQLLQQARRFESAYFSGPNYPETVITTQPRSFMRPEKSRKDVRSETPSSETVLLVPSKSSSTTNTKRNNKNQKASIFSPRHKAEVEPSSDENTVVKNDEAEPDFSPKKFYEVDGDQFFRTVEYPPLDDEGYAQFEPQSLGPSLHMIFRRMLNYKFRPKGNSLQDLKDMKIACVRALPDIPVAIEFADEVNYNARMRPRAFAICGEDMLPKYYALEHTPPHLAVLNCIPCFSCLRQPFNLTIFGLDGHPITKVKSELLENACFLRHAKKICCCCLPCPIKRMTIRSSTDGVEGTLVEVGHCCMTQRLQLHSGVPTHADLENEGLVDWQTRCRCFDCSMIYCGCKTDTDSEVAMFFTDKEGRVYACARPWEGVSSLDFPFLYSMKFTEDCPIELKKLALGASFIYNNIEWETRTDHTFCDYINCIFCTTRCCSKGGPVTMNLDNWSNLPTRSQTAYLPWKTVQRPRVFNYRHL